MGARRVGIASRKQGGVLVAALVAVMAVAVMATCLLQVSRMTARRQSYALERRRAFYLAEAGLAEAYTGMMIGKTGAVGTEERPAKLGNGLVWVEATALDERRVQLVSTGMSGRGQAILAMSLELGETSVASLGVFANEPLDIPPGVQISGFDSSAGGEEALELPGDPSEDLSTIGRVGSNAEMAVSGTRAQPTVVRADLMPGPLTEVLIEGNVSHTGTIEPRSEPAPLPPVEVPFAPEGSGMRTRGSVPVLLGGGDVGLVFLDVTAGGSVVLQGPCTLVVDDLTVASGGTLELDATLGPISVFVRDQLSFADGSMISSKMSDPGQAIVQVESTTAALVACSGQFQGVLYAPQAEVTVGASAQILGALVANQLVLSSGAELIFDQHLDELSEDASLPKFLSWRIVEMSNAVAGEGGMDAFSLLGVDSSTLESPADSHADQWLHVVYEGSGGATFTYDGMESLFDWRQVREVVELARDGRQVLFPGLDPTNTPPAPPATPALAAIKQDPPLSSSELRDRLLGLSPLSLDEILAAIGLSPGLSSSHLRAVLEGNGPLGSTELGALIDRANPISSSDLKDVLLDSSPLPADVLARVILGDTPLDLSDQLAVIAGQ